MPTPPLQLYTARKCRTFSKAGPRWRSSEARPDDRDAAGDAGWGLTSTLTAMSSADISEFSNQPGLSLMSSAISRRTTSDRLCDSS